MSNKVSSNVLFDLSFTEFVTTRIVKVAFISAVAFAALGAVVLIVGGFINDVATGLVALVLAPAAFLLSVLFSRIWCELIIVMFRIAENTGRLVEQNRP